MHSVKMCVFHIDAFCCDGECILIVWYFHTLQFIIVDVWF